MVRIAAVKSFMEIWRDQRERQSSGQNEIQDLAYFAAPGGVRNPFRVDDVNRVVAVQQPSASEYESPVF